MRSLDEILEDMDRLNDELNDHYEAHPEEWDEEGNDDYVPDQSEIF